MKNSTILREARQSIANRTDSYICYAISDANSGTYQQRLKLQRWVMQMLHPYDSYSGWLAAKHPEFYRKKRITGCKPGRLQWLDWMIQYWEAKGK
jgi:hypothetical protein